MDSSGASNKRKLTELYPIENPSSPDKMDVDEPTQLICLKLFLLVVAQMSKEQATPQRISNVDATQVLTHLDCLSVVTRKMISTSGAVTKYSFEGEDGLRRAYGGLSRAGEVFG
ncbi:hypothetical protein FIE12Z_12326 [Fusarium flagelliforme]|uniref:Uncharacterized protein n=1 Tax=Fusarium flagelliforme TaxID=2675880 RepID=A0A395M6F8_9HYPO|nr:hypothetical protein FIE12Z_12326 [Fusarium flagelliforme]